MKRILFLSFILSSLLTFEAKSQIIVNVTNVSAPGLCDGSAFVDTNNFVTAASLTWMQGNTVIQNGGYMISNLCAGQYNLLFMGSGFTSTSTFTIGTNLPNPCTGYSIFCGSTPTSAANVCDGSVNVTAVGGSAPYTYQWSNGGMINTPALTNLCIGTYSVTVIDANGCSETSGATVVVDSTIANPCAGFYVNCSNIDATSSTACDGSATINIVGGTNPYTVQWSNGSTSLSIGNLCVGNYTVMVQDNNQCTFNWSCTIGNSSPNIDSVTVIGNLATGSNVIGTMSSGWIYNCTIDLAALDTAYMVSATFGNTMFTQDSLYTTWYLVDTNGNYMYVNYNYSIPFGTTGLYNLILQLYCPIKSQPVYYNIISVLNLEEAGLEGNNLSQMNVYPNPAQNELNIGNITSAFDFTLTNMDGKIIQSGQVSPTNSTIDLTNVAAGTYLVQLKNTQNAFTYRVIK
ncbi:MAG: T9SS type A sorting domain-containing protein [Crocinitomicaceae bacterium]|nr:T9SS type A sorting domain-containing protein [Crocinitomicaceae bacterium]MBP6032204.1 T9SS type A sorting domain-containing protein [Crocinitomicaceae bacterium]